MKKLKKSLLLCLILTIFMNVIIYFAPIKVSANTTTSEVVIERDSLRILHAKNENEKMENASTTKIVTAICVIENCNLFDEVVIGDESVGIEGSSIYLHVGDERTVEELLFGLMLQSGNDAAHALATFVGGSIEKFARMMNALAIKCGAVNSNFVNPHGLHDDNHYTTAKDLALITCYALKNPVFSKIVSTKKVAFGDRVYLNKNKMLTSFDGADGVKTGFTKHSGRCLVTSATRDKMQLVSVVLNSSNMYERSAELLNKSYNEYSFCEVVKKGEKIGSVDKSNLNKTVILNKGLKIPLRENERENLKTVFKNTHISGNEINIGDLVGELIIYNGEKIIFSSKMYAVNVFDDCVYVQMLFKNFNKLKI